MGINTKRGSRGQLVVNRDGNFQGDLQALADEIAGGRIFKGTHEEGKALLANPEAFGMKSGDLFHEIYYEDYSETYDALGDSVSRLFVYSSGGGAGRGHFTPYDGGRNKSWGYFRGADRATDDLAPGKFTSVCRLVARGTDWGSYMVHISGKWFTANAGQSTIGYRRILVQGKSIPAMVQANQGAGIGDIPSNLGYADNDLSISFPWTFTPGSDAEIGAQGYPVNPVITVELLLNPANATGRIWNAGLGVSLVHLGRNYI